MTLDDTVAPLLPRPCFEELGSPLSRPPP
ncbi:hypothetical protein M3J09_008052 [Ascochyta lentis]